MQVQVPGGGTQQSPHQQVTGGGRGAWLLSCPQPGLPGQHLDTLQYTALWGDAFTENEVIDKIFVAKNIW